MYILICEALLTICPTQALIKEITLMLHKGQLGFTPYLQHLITIKYIEFLKFKGKMRGLVPLPFLNVHRCVELLACWWGGNILLHHTPLLQKIMSSFSWDPLLYWNPLRSQTSLWSSSPTPLLCFCFYCLFSTVGSPPSILLSLLTNYSTDFTISLLISSITLSIWSICWISPCSLLCCISSPCWSKGRSIW